MITTGRYLPTGGVIRQKEGRSVCVVREAEKKKSHSEFRKNTIKIIGVCFSISPSVVQFVGPLQQIDIEVNERAFMS